MFDIIFNFLDFSPKLIVAMFVISTLIAIVSKIRYGVFFERLIFGYLYFLPWIVDIALILTFLIPINWGEEGIILVVFWGPLNFVAFVAMVVQLVVLEIKRRIK